MTAMIQVNLLGKQYRKVITHGQNMPNFRDALLNFGKTEKREEFWALKDINFQIEKGEVIGVVGKNGSGKSTLFKILSQITKPTTGEAVLRGRVSSLLEVGTGFHQELSGRENIFLNGVILGMKRQEIRDRFAQIVDFSGIGDFLDDPVKYYSSGMYMRLAFAIATHLVSEIMIVDEVLAVGDWRFQQQCFQKIRQLVTDEGRTVLLVSHHLPTVNKLCDKCIWLEHGKLKAMGATNKILPAYEKSVA